MMLKVLKKMCTYEDKLFVTKSFFMDPGRWRSNPKLKTVTVPFIALCVITEQDSVS